MKDKAKFRRQSQSTHPKSTRTSNYTNWKEEIQLTAQKSSQTNTKVKQPVPSNSSLLRQSTRLHTNSLFSDPKIDHSFVSETEIDELLFSSSVQEEESTYSSPTDKKPIPNKTKYKIEGEKEKGVNIEFTLFIRNFLKTWRVFFNILFKLLKLALVLLLSLLPSSISHITKLHHLFPFSTQLLIHLTKIACTETFT